MTLEEWQAACARIDQQREGYHVALRDIDPSFVRWSISDLDLKCVERFPYPVKPAAPWAPREVFDPNHPDERDMRFRWNEHGLQVQTQPESNWFSAWEYSAVTPRRFALWKALEREWENRPR